MQVQKQRLLKISFSNIIDNEYKWKASRMKKVIFLVDMNAFFISCEMSRNPDLKGIPAAVAGDPKNRSGIILAANYEARAFGIKTTMVLYEAFRLCPMLKLVPPDHTFYEHKSEQVMQVLSRFTPVIEQASVDEAWLDMTGTEILFGEPLKAAQAIMDTIKNELSLWCSIGISDNKFLSKMAAEMKKPLGITELWKKDLAIKMWPLPAVSMYGVGKQTAARLEKLGIYTIGDLAHFDKTCLVKIIGKSGYDLHDRANGIDASLVLPHKVDEMKSIGRSTTLPADIIDIDLAAKVLMELSDDICMSARRHHKKGRTVQITIKYTNFEVITRQNTIPATHLTKDVYAAGMELLRKNWDKSLSVRLLGITLSGFDETEQICFFDSVVDEKAEKLECALDEIRSKHGNLTIKRGSLL